MSSLKKGGFPVLVIDDEAQIRKLIRGRLERRGYEVFEAEEGAAAILLASKHNPWVVVSDIRMPGLDGFGVLEAIKVPTILITGHGDKETAIQAVEKGAFSFFEKPFDMEALEVAVQRAGERFQLELEKAELIRKLESLCKLQNRELEFLDKQIPSRFIGESPKVQEVREVLKRLVIKPKASLLILGETGTGKEVVARELHLGTHGNSTRSPFLALNCASIPADLFESELYGHEKGSFSGAHAQRIGLAEAVRDGTLFLDEMGEMDPKHQAKLLRLIQERSFRRVGSNTELSFNGRIVAATHKNLKDKEVFREDLFYRLSVISVSLPPLRERGADVVMLANEICKRFGLKGIHPDRMAELSSYAWPGNIRELNNWIERASILEEQDSAGLVVSKIPGTEKLEQEDPQISPIQTHSEVGDLKAMREQMLERFDRQWIVSALEQSDWNIAAAARKLAIDRKNLAKRIKELGIAQDFSKKAA